MVHNVWSKSTHVEGSVDDWSISYEERNLIKKQLTVKQIISIVNQLKLTNGKLYKRKRMLLLLNIR